MSQPCFDPAIAFLSGESPEQRQPRAFPLAAHVRQGEKRSRRPFLVLLTLAVALVWTQTSPADQGLLRGPGKAVRMKATLKEPAAGPQGVLEDIASVPVLFYQRFLSRHWGQTCAYYPSCSNYALLAIRKHGAVIGTVIAFDRLQHEINEARTSSRILADGRMKLYDPLENNDDWWYIKTRFEPISHTGAGKYAED